MVQNVIGNMMQNGSDMMGGMNGMMQQCMGMIGKGGCSMMGGNAGFYSNNTFLYWVGAVVVGSLLFSLIFWLVYKWMVEKKR